MENIKEKLNFLFRLYLSYMQLASWGTLIFTISYISFFLIVNYLLIAILLLSVALIIVLLSLYKYRKGNQINKPKGFFLLKISHIFFGIKDQKDVFEPIVADWNEEVFKELNKKNISKARWINARYTYAFIAAMWQKSPIGDLIEFVVKIAKG